MGCSAFIIGAGGQDGSLLLEKFINNDLSICVFLGSKGFNSDLNHRRLVLNATRTGQLQFYKSLKFESIEFEQLLLKHRPKALYYLASKEVQGPRETRLSNIELQEYTNYEIPKTIIKKILKNNLKTKFIYAGSSRMYLGYNGYNEIKEDTKYAPIDIYAKTKIKTIDLLEKKWLKDSLEHNIAILFNHDSERRRNGYLSRDIVDQFVERIVSNKKSPLEIINSEYRLDWLGARDIVEALFKMSQSNEVGKFVLGSGKLTKIEDVINDINLFFSCNYDILNIKKNKQNNFIFGNYEKANFYLGWRPKEQIKDILINMINLKISINKNLNS